MAYSFNIPSPAAGEGEGGGFGAALEICVSMGSISSQPAQFPGDRMDLQI